MKCPYCYQDLDEIIPYVYSCSNHDCKAVGITLPEYIWHDIIYGVRLKDVLLSKEVEAKIQKGLKIINLSVKTEE